MLLCGSLERVRNLLPEMNFCSQVYIFKFTEVEIYCNKTRENHWRDVLEVEQDKRKTNTENTIFLALQCNPHRLVQNDFVFLSRLTTAHNTINHTYKIWSGAKFYRMCFGGVSLKIAQNTFKKHHHNDVLTLEGKY